MKKAIIIFLIVIIILATIVICWYNGVFTLNNPSKKEYPIKGIDVSSYQGNINWEVLSQQDIQFAFIKATEGSNFVDHYFKKNWEDALKTNLYVGAYHFFSYDSEGSSQADNYIKTVPKSEGILPPVVDIEFYGDKYKNLPDVKETQKQLKSMIDRLEEYYGVKAIIYATNKSYNLYIENNFKDNYIWIRDVYFSPKLKDNRNWTFWQFTDKVRLNGYDGKEKQIDVNVFNGNA